MTVKTNTGKPPGSKSNFKLETEEVQPVTLEELNQVVKLMEWANTTASFHTISLRTFKQLFHKPKKQYRIMWELHSLEWKDQRNDYRTSRGTGHTIMEAMINFNTSWSRTDGLPF